MITITGRIFQTSLPLAWRCLLCGSRPHDKGTVTSYVGLDPGKTPETISSAQERNPAELERWIHGLPEQHEVTVSCMREA